MRAQMTGTTDLQVSKGLTPKRVKAKMPEGGYTVPVTFTPTSEQFAECTVIDSNADTKTWSFDSSKKAFKYTYNISKPADDWVVLPQVKAPGTPIKLEFEYFSQTSNDDEAFEVWTGSTAVPSEMTKVYENLKVTNKTAEKQEVVITPTGDDIYVAFHAVSAKNKYYLYIKNVKFTSLDNAAPGMVSNFTATMDGPDCTVAFNLPTANLGGTPYDADAEIGALVYVDGNVTETAAPLAGKPGAALSTTLTLAKGDHVVGVCSYVDLNGVRKISEPVTANVRSTKKYIIPMPVPFTFAPDVDEFNLCTVVNRNDDNNTWAFAESGNNGNRPSFRYTYSYTKEADDWLILPEIKGNAQGVYELAFDLATKFSEERVMVFVGSTATVADLEANCIYDSGSVMTDDKWTTVKVNFTRPAGENFFIAFKAASPANRSYIYLSNVSVNTADPKRPVLPAAAAFDLNGGNGKLNFTLPAVTLDGEAIAASEMTVEVTVDAAEPLTAAAAPGAIAGVDVAGLALGKHTYSARAGYALGGEMRWSEPITGSFAVTLPADFAYELPASLAMNAADQDTYIVIDANNDGKTWSYSANDNGFKYSYHSTNPGNDWIMTPAINIPDVSKLLRLGLNIKSGSGTESLEVYIGKDRTPEAMTTLVMSKEVKGLNSYTNFTSDFVLPEPGKYHVGIKCTSPKNSYWLYVNTLTLASTGSSPKAPGQLAGLTAVPDQTGANKATVTFTLPTLDMTGQALDAATALTATAVCGEYTATATGTPGQEVSLTIDTKLGDNTIKVSAANEFGAGPEASVSVKCGLDRPKAPRLTAVIESDDNLSVTLKWNPVTEGVTGGAVNAPAIRYRIYEYDPNDEDWYFVEDVDSCSYTYSVSPNATQDIVLLGVDAYNAVNSGSSMVGVNVNIGKPYGLPMNEDFAGGYLHYNPIGLSSSLQADVAPTWSLGKPDTAIAGSNPASGYALIGATTMSRGDSRITLPRFSTENLNIVNVTVPAYCHANSAQISVYAYGLGMDTALKLGDLDTRSTTGWKDFTFAMPQELCGKKWVQVYMFVNFPNGSSNIAIIGGYKLSGEQVAASRARAYQMGDEKGKFGFVEFNVDNYTERTIVKSTLAGGTHISAGEGVNGKYYAYSVEADPFGAIYAANFETYSLADYSLISSTPNAQERRVVDMTYDYSNNTLYALVEDAPETGKIGRTSLCVVDPATGAYTRVGSAGAITAIDGYGREVETVLVTLAADNEGNIYAMSDHRQFYSLNKYTGAATQIGTQHKMATDNTFQSMAFDRLGTLYWTQQHPDYSRFLTVNKATGEPTLIDGLSDNPQITGLFFDKPFNAAAPAAVTGLSAVTGETAPNQVTLSWTLPTADCAGQPIALSSVVVYRLGNATPLATLAADATTYVDEAAPNGDIAYYVTTVANGLTGVPATATVKTGNDVVNAPTNITVTMDATTGTASWTAPTTTVNGRYADFSAMTYDVDLVLGTTVTNVAKGISETSTQFNVNKAGTYTLRVSPTVGGVQGLSGESAPFTVEILFTIPYATGFEDNQDGTLWSFIRGAHHVSATYGANILLGSAYMRLDGKYAEISTGGSAEYADDWLISPPINFAEAGTYKLSYALSNGVASDEQSWSTQLGTDPADAASFTLPIASYSKEKVAGSWTASKEETFTVQTPGIYHLGIHGTTTEIYAKLRIDNLKIEAVSTGLNLLTVKGALRLEGNTVVANRGLAAYKLVNVAGTLISESSDMKGDTVVRLSNVEPGAYILTARFEDGTHATLKLFKR